MHFIMFEQPVEAWQASARVTHGEGGKLDDLRFLGIQVYDVHYSIKGRFGMQCILYIRANCKL